MKVTLGTIACNSMPLIPHFLAYYYDEVDEIIIAEGADRTYRKLINSIRSTDGTIEAIMDFPDPDNKIKLVQGDFSTKDDMTFAIDKSAETDLFLLFDTDEFLPPPQVRKVIKIFEENPTYHSFNLYKMPIFKHGWEARKITGRGKGKLSWPNFNACWENRLWEHGIRAMRQRKHEGFTIGHIPVCYRRTSNLRSSLNGRIWPTRPELERDSELYIRHFSWRCEKQLMEKVDYHVIRNRQPTKVAAAMKNAIKRMFSMKTADGSNVSWKQGADYGKLPTRWIARPFKDDTIPQALLDDIKKLNS